MTIFRIIAGSWLARIYLIYVVVMGAVVYHSLATWDRPDANFAAVGVILPTMPGSFVLFLLPQVSGPAGTAIFVAGIVFGALVNAAALTGLAHLAGALVRRLRGPHPAGN
jgi:hypothetical protein